LPDASPMTVATLESRFLNDAHPLLGEYGARVLLDDLRHFGDSAAGPQAPVFFEHLSAAPPDQRDVFDPPTLH
jgi:hypothetical protein